MTANTTTANMKGLKKFQELGILLSSFFTFLFAAFVLAELTSFGSYPATSNNIRGFVL